MGCLGKTHRSGSPTSCLPVCAVAAGNLRATDTQQSRPPQEEAADTPASPQKKRRAWIPWLLVAALTAALVFTVPKAFANRDTVKDDEDGTTEFKEVSYSDLDGYFDSRNRTTDWQHIQNL